MFVGRDKELHSIEAAITRKARSGGVIAIHAIDGMPGVGKTALAVRVAHRLVGRFPDRQLFIDLHAHTPGQSPIQPGDALAELLTADGVDPRFLPTSLDARAALWRDRMANKRLLLLLDNAASSEQIIPLLPNAPRCLVVVTSRRSLGDLPSAVPLPLDVLTPDAATRMFMQLAPRAADQPGDVAELVRTCGFLPLALSIAASLYLRRPSWTLIDLVRELQESTGRMLTITAENRTVAAVFDLSYQNLALDRQRFFRLLGLHPGVEIDAYAAAALTDTSLDRAVEHLDELYNDRLIDEPAFRRYRMHDLIRYYAGAKTISTDPVAERDRAIERLLGYYQHVASRADRYLSRYALPASNVTVNVPGATPTISSRDRAATWLRTERANVIACIQHATTGGRPAHTVGLTATVAALLRIDGPWMLAIELHRTAADAAQLLGDRQALATALNNLGAARQLSGDYPTAAELLHKALDLYRDIGDQQGQANALNELGILQWQAGDYPGAADLQRKALDLYRNLGDKHGQATALNELAVIQLMTGDYPDATDLLRQALNIQRNLGDRQGQTNTLTELGVVRWLTGDYPGAANLLEQAFDLCRVLGNRLSQANTFNYLGRVRWVTGDYTAAADLLREALDLYRDLGDRRGEATALNDLGVVEQLRGNHTGAAELHRQALHLYRDLGSRHGQALAFARQGVVSYLTGDYTTADALLQQASATLHEIGTPDDEAEVLNHLGILRRLTGQPEEAQALHHAALTTARSIHHRLEEGRALEGIGRAALDLGDTTAGISHLRKAQEIYVHLGVPEATRVTAEFA